MSTPRWARAAARHHAAVEELTRRVREVDGERWRHPRGPGKWSAAEETLHVVRTYETVLSELAGGAGMRLRVPRWRAALYRWIILPRILKSGRFPAGIRAPREIRPDADAAARHEPEELLERLRRRVAEVEAALEPRGAGPTMHVTHAYFGALAPELALRLLTTHTAHHARQIGARSS